MDFVNCLKVCNEDLYFLFTVLLYSLYFFIFFLKIRLQDFHLLPKLPKQCLLLIYLHNILILNLPRFNFKLVELRCQLKVLFLKVGHFLFSLCDREMLILADYFELMVLLGQRIDMLDLRCDDSVNQV